MYKVVEFFRKIGFLRFFSIFISIIALTVLILQLCEIVTVETTTLALIGMFAIPIISEITVEIKGTKISLKTKSDVELLKNYEESSPMFNRVEAKDKKLSYQYKKDLNKMKKDNIEIQLAKIRMYITEKLNKLAEINGMGNLGLSIGYWSDKLDDIESLDENDSLFIRELLDVINKNLKGNKSEESVNYIKSIYPKIMEILDKKIQEGEKNETSNS
ncbi:MAG: hypothetical protein ACOCP4_05830 [Candidatus Woesearchaeota archaeon]